MGIDARKLSLSERVEALKLWMRDPLSRVESNVVLEALHVRNIANAQFKLLKYGVLDIPSYEVLPNSPHKKLASDLEEFNRAVKMYHEWRAEQEFYYQPTQ